ncbi:MAG: response regulator transcription factor [Pyramidobacter sp.]
MEKILIVEDDRLIAELERDYLEAAGYAVEMTPSGKEGLRMALSDDYDLVLLDVMLPEMSGFEVCRRLRREKNVSLIMVTALKDDVDKIRGLGLGADDYVVKPFSPSELTARVKAHIAVHRRLLGQKREEPLTVGNLKILPLSRRAFLNEREIPLTKREYDLLLFLASHPNVVFSREQLFERIWEETPLGDTATVTVHVNRLREKIEADPSHPEYIETVWGVGYRFMKD